MNVCHHQCNVKLTRVAVHVDRQQQTHHHHRDTHNVSMLYFILTISHQLCYQNTADQQQQHIWIDDFHLYLFYNGVWECLMPVFCFICVCVCFNVLCNYCSLLDICVHNSCHFYTYRHFASIYH